MAEKDIYKKIKITNPQSTTINNFERVYKGFSTVNPNNESFNFYDISIIKQDLINHFHIRKGEKLSNPNYGTIIWDVLFEPMTNSLKELIKDDVTNIISSDPRVVADEIIVNEYENGIQIECTLSYLPYNVSESMIFKFDQNNGLL